MQDISLERFNRTHYRYLIDWVNSEELLMQFAGPSLSFPLTAAQLDVSSMEPRRFTFIILHKNSAAPIGHAEVYDGDTTAKLGRIIIGDAAWRGKGIGEKVVRLLLDFSFHELNSSVAELNVFDWNTPAIRCYEKVGFRNNPGVSFERKIKGLTWIALNMRISRGEYELLKIG